MDTQFSVLSLGHSNAHTVLGCFLRDIPVEILYIASVSRSSNLLETKSVCKSILFRKC